MSTEAQINANRLNAQKSTGPTSPEGKARSALNALKSGIDAWSHIIAGEDPAELETLTEQFLQHYRPVDPVQLSLVDTLISAEWIQRRLRRIEAQVWNYRVDILDQNLTRAEFVDPATQRNSPLGHAFHAALDPFTRIQRRIDSTNRMFLRTLKALQDLQAAASQSAAASETIQPAAQAVAAQPLKPEIGFVPQSAPTLRQRSHVSHENQRIRPASGHIGRLRSLPVTVQKISSSVFGDVVVHDANCQQSM
jgi:hypothetical protein